MRISARHGAVLAGALLSTAALTLPLATPAGAVAPVRADTPRTVTVPTTSLGLPDGFQPEGIATAGQHTVLVSSRASGDVYAINTKSGKGRTLATGPGTPSLGLEVDAKHRRLYVAGGTGGDARVLDLNSGRLIRSYRLTTNSSFVNDQIITPRGVFFTDSAQAQLYRLPLGRHGTLPKRAQTVPLTGQWTQVAGNNANGITRTPDGKALLVVNSSSGVLYRVSYSGHASVVDLGGADLTNGDGLLQHGRTLLAVQNQDNKIAVVRLGRAGRAGTVQSYLTSRKFDVPSTVAARGNDLFLPNARFTTPATATTTYTVNDLHLR